MVKLNLKEKFPIIETERVILREFRRSDAEDVFEYASLPKVSRYLSWDAHKDMADSYKFIEFIDAKYEKGFPEWAIEMKESGKMVGSVGIVRMNEANRKGEIGYVLNPDYWGRGITAEAVLALFGFLFENMKLNRVEAIHILENPASGRVMEKAGMQCEGIQRQSHLQKGKFYDIKLYSMLQSEWESGHRIPTHFYPNFRVSVEAIIIRGDRVLLTKRAEDCYVEPGIWHIPTGKVKYDEVPAVAVIREVREETTLEIEIERELLQYSWKGKTTDGEPAYRLFHTYLVKDKGDPAEVTINQEHQTFAWASQDELNSAEYSSLNENLKKLISEELK